MAQKAEDDDKVRLDKWLWAARFYKTRALAKAAIESGKVHCRGERCKPGKEPRVGDEFVLRTGFDDRTVVVKALSWCGVGRRKRRRCMKRPKTVCAAASRRPRCARPGRWG
jgi:heat shock protein Hsp15